MATVVAMVADEEAEKNARKIVKRNISAVAREKIGAVIHINHTYFIYLYSVLAVQP